MLLLPTTTVCVVATPEDVPVPVPVDELEAVDPLEVVVPDAVPFAARLCPTARAAFLKFVNEFVVPSAPQFTANTMPCPQCEAAVFAAWAQYTHIG